MKAITEKFDTLKSVAKSIGVKDGTIRIWHHRGYVPGAMHLKLINASKRKLVMSDFLEGEGK